MSKSNNFFLDALNVQDDSRVPTSKEESKLLRIFEEIPVPLEEFISGDDYLGSILGNTKLSPTQYDAVRHFTQVLYPETYISMSEVWDERFSPVRNVNNLAIAWGKGCQAPHTPVYDASTGRWVRLDSIKDGSLVASSYEDGKVFSSEAVAGFLEGVGSMYRVETKSGNISEVYAGHKFLVATRKNFKKPHQFTWVRLDQLSPGDKIVMVSRVPEPENVIDLPEHHVELLGLFTGDGCMPSDRSAQPGICGGALATSTKDRTVELLNKLPNTTVRTSVRDYDGKWTAFTKNTDRTGRPRNPLMALLESYGAANSAYFKRVPEAIFSASNEQIALYVSRLIDTDGWISVSNAVEVGYGSVSKDLIEDLRKLLLRLGVASGVRKKIGKYKGENHISWQLKIRRVNFVEALLRQLNLLDKEPARLAALEVLSSRKQTWATVEDFWFDPIKSIDYIGEGEYWTTTVDGPSSYVSNSGTLDHNSGKDFIIQIGFAYIAYQLLCLKSPQDYFGVPGNTYIHLLNVAISATQALTVFYTPLRDMLVASKFFSSKFIGDIPGPRASTMYLKHNIVLVSGHSEASSLEGKNILAGVLDEIAGFPTEADAASTGRSVSKTAEGLIKMVRSSAQTRFPDTSKVALISFARRHGDAIMKALEEAKEDEETNGEKSTYYHSHKETWAVNPRWLKYEFITIPQSNYKVPNVPSIINDYRKDPVFARGYYECRPEKSANPYFKDKDAIKKSFSKKLEKDPLEIEYFYGVARHEGDKYPSWQVRFTLNELHPIDGACYSIHADMAKNGDVAGIAMSHVKEYQEIVTPTFDNSHTEEMRPVISVDFATAFTHDMSATDGNGISIPREIQMRWFRKLVLWLSDRGFNIAAVSMDGWQSLDSLQTLETKGYDTQKRSTDVNTAIWQTVKDVMYDGRLEGYYNERVITEFESLTKLPNGKVDHPSDFGKDIADAIGCSIAGAIEAGGSEEDGTTDFFGGGYRDNMDNPFGGSVQTNSYGLDSIDTSLVNQNFSGSG